MKKLITLALLLMATTALAGGKLEKDLNGNLIQGFAPDGNYSQTLTVASVTYDMTSDMMWSLYAPSTGCKIRITPTSAKGSFPQHTIPDAMHIVRVVNRNTPFINYSGCTNGELQRQR